MRHQGRGVHILFVFFIMTLTYGCSSFRVGNLPEITDWPLSPASTEYNLKVVTISSGAELTVNGATERPGKLLLGMVNDKARDAYAGSGLFRLANPRYDYEPDYIIEVMLKDEETVDPYSILFSVLTLFIKEGQMMDDYTLTTTIKDKKGEVLAKIEKSDSIVYKQRLGLFFSIFSRLPDVVSKETIYDLNRATIKEALSKGVFQ
ncbi:MAG: hypothetical protein HY891_05165 [Deltaproteobacteria bacterium]|nr:hypothetical protein [Deltaproteobacteria bacterium]